MSDKQNKRQPKKNDFNIVPCILFAVSTATFLIGTLLPWFVNCGNLYCMFELSEYDLFHSLDEAAIIIFPVTIMFAVLTVLQIINCFVKRNWIRIISGILGILVNITPWLTFLGSAMLLTVNYASMLGVGVYVSAIGSILTAIFSIVLLATNRKKKTNY